MKILRCTSIVLYANRFSDEHTQGHETMDNEQLDAIKQLIYAIAGKETDIIYICSEITRNNFNPSITTAHFRTVKGADCDMIVQISPFKSIIREDKKAS